MRPPTKPTRNAPPARRPRMLTRKTPMPTKVSGHQPRLGKPASITTPDAAASSTAAHSGRTALGSRLPSIAERILRNAAVSNDPAEDRVQRLACRRSHGRIGDDGELVEEVDRLLGP